jgi:AcrR family transcriptional regulator
MRYKAGIETRDKILEATRNLIATEGMDGTTIKAICDQAGVLPGSFYNLFDSKEQVILTVVRQAIDAIDPDPTHRGPDSLSDLVEAYVSFVLGQGELARVYIRLAVSGGSNNEEIEGRIMRHHQARVARFKTAVCQGHPSLSELDAERLAETLVTSLNGMTLHRVLDPGFDIALHARVLLANTLAGV